MFKKNLFSQSALLRYKKKLVYTHNTHFEKIFQSA